MRYVCHILSEIMQKQEENWKIHKYMEIKQHIPEKSMGRKINQKRNQKISWYKWKWKHDTPKHMDATKTILRGEFIIINAYIKKKEKLQINNINLQ